MASEKFDLMDRDVIGITRSFVARAQGNYVSLEDIASAVKEKYTGNSGSFSILSRNRFSMILKAVAMSVKRFTCS